MCPVTRTYKVATAYLGSMECKIVVAMVLYFGERSEALECGRLLPPFLAGGLPPAVFCT